MVSCFLTKLLRQFNGLDHELDMTSKPGSIKSLIIELQKIKNFCISKDTIKKNEKTDLENIFVYHVSAKGLMSV